MRKIVLVDKLWPMRSSALQPHHISWHHILAPGWPIPLETRKADLKKPNQTSQFEQHVYPPAAGPAMLLGVHLCGTLAVRAVQLFNATPQVSAVGQCTENSASGLCTDTLRGFWREVEGVGMNMEGRMCSKRRALCEM